jgi:hypothetical protein
MSNFDINRKLFAFSIAKALDVSLKDFLPHTNGGLIQLA